MAHTQFCRDYVETVIADNLGADLSGPLEIGTDAWRAFNAEVDRRTAETVATGEMCHCDDA